MNWYNIMMLSGRIIRDFKVLVVLMLNQVDCSTVLERHGCRSFSSGKLYWYEWLFVLPNGKEFSYELRRSTDASVGVIYFVWIRCSHEIWRMCERIRNSVRSLRIYPYFYQHDLKSAMMRATVRGLYCACSI